MHELVTINTDRINARFNYEIEEKYGNLRMIGVPNENLTADFLTTKQN